MSYPRTDPTPFGGFGLSGAVAQPGVYGFKHDDRLRDVLESAGGLLADADASAVNMAALLEDEQHYHFPTISESREPATRALDDDSTADNQSRATDAAPSPENLLELNTASPAELQTLPGIGTVKDEAIVEFRDTFGPFGETSEITSVPGIGPATYENIRHLITVAPINP